MAEKKFNVKYGVLLPIVLLVTLFLWCVPVSFFGIDALTVVQQRVIALFVFAALMWMFEIIPNWATSVLIIVVALLTVSDKGLGFFCNPEFGQLVSYKKIMSSFADPVVMLFLGGFVLAIMAERFGLDVTLAKSLLSVFGTKPKMVLLGFLIIRNACNTDCLDFHTTCLVPLFIECSRHIFSKFSCFGCHIGNTCSVCGHLVDGGL